MSERLVAANERGEVRSPRGGILRDARMTSVAERNQILREHIVFDFIDMMNVKSSFPVTVPADSALVVVSCMDRLSERVIELRWVWHLTDGAIDPREDLLHSRALPITRRSLPKRTGGLVCAAREDHSANGTRLLKRDVSIPVKLDEHCNATFFAACLPLAKPDYVFLWLPPERSATSSACLVGRNSGAFCRSLRTCAFRTARRSQFVIGCHPLWSAAKSFSTPGASLRRKIIAVAALESPSRGQIDVAFTRARLAIRVMARRFSDSAHELLTANLTRPHVENIPRVILEGV